MDDPNLRNRNKQLAWTLLAGMVILAGLTAGFVLLTTTFRRQVDTLQPESRPLRSDLLIVVTIAVAVVIVSLIAYLNKTRRKS